MNPEEQPGPNPPVDLPQSPAPAARTRWMLRTALVLAGLVLLALIAGIVVVRSERFHTYIRTRIVQVAERLTGARVELGGYYFDWTHLEAGVNNLVLHGKESSDDAPLVRIDTATVGLRIISIMERSIDLASLRVENPQVHVIIYPDGSTNFPGPPGRSNRLWSEELLNLKIKQYEITNGSMDYDNRRMPLDIRGQNLRIHMTYDAQLPSYFGDFASDALRIDLPPNADVPQQPIEASIQTDFRLERNQVSFRRMQLETLAGSTAQLSGTLQDLRAPHGTLTLRATTLMREAVQRFHLPLDPVGTAALNGQLTIGFGTPFQFGIDGHLVATGLGYSQDRLKFENARLEGDAQITRSGFVLRQMNSRILDAGITGEGRLEDWSRLHISGAIDGLTVQRAANVLTSQPIAWEGSMSGTFNLDATLRRTDILARLNLGIMPLAPVLPASQPGEAAPGGPAVATPRQIPIQGHVDLVYDQAAGTVALGSSAVETAATRLEVSGTLGRQLRVRLRSTDLNDIQPVLRILRDSAETTDLPVALRNGSVNLDGTVEGTLEAPQFEGQVAVANAVIRGYNIDRFAAEVSAGRNSLLARNIVAARGVTQVTGTAALAPRGSAAPGSPGSGLFAAFDDSQLSGQLNARNVAVAELLTGLGLRNAGNAAPPIDGNAAAAIRVSGSVQQPEFSIALDVADPSAYGERFDRLRANVRYLPGLLELSDGLANDAASQVRFTGRYQHPAADWKSGDLTLDIATGDLPSTRLEHMAQLPLPVTSVFSGTLHAAGKVVDGVFSLASANADLAARGVTVDTQPIGNFAVQATTQGSTLSLEATGNVRESRVEAKGTWRLDGNLPGAATLKFTRLTAASARTLAMLGVPLQQHVRELPVDGFIEGGANITIALQDPKAFRALVTLETIQVSGKSDQALSLGLQPDDLILRNSQPVVLDITATEARLRPAQFFGRDTNLTAAGTIPFRSDTGADLSVRGNMNLIILQLLYVDLVAQGSASVEATIRGNLREPNINGRLTLANTRLEVKDLPNGLDKAQGTIVFDRRRATIERLTAETGGGTLSFTGFLEFGTTVVYRVQADIRQVRVRYPQDVSTTFSGILAFNGTPDASTLTGTVNLNRVALTARADLGQLAAQLSQSDGGSGAATSYLSGLQLNILIESGPNFQMETSLTRDLEADISLRLRGSPVRPVLLGSISIDRGEVQVFGNRYTVERGDIRFLNPVKIEPTFDMNLSTRARGVTVNVSFSGTMAHLNPNYSSDPPLQSSEIFALLAVGRDPLSASQLAPGTPGAGGNSVFQAGSSILGEALSAQVSNRVQRFFGASHVRIDPTLTGVDNLPQARLTLEQQVSKDITLTYITNLNRGAEQIVRVQWDINREWSAIAVRDQNGLFGIDFQFRKRFD